MPDAPILRLAGGEKLRATADEIDAGVFGGL